VTARKRRPEPAATSPAPSAETATSPADRLDTWFATRGWRPFGFQREVWDAFARGESGLIHAATGTGKTLAAWLAAVRNAEPCTEAPPLTVLWITPLRALAADTERALREPLEAIGLPWTIESRTGDTKAAARARQRVRLPTALVTTPESFTLLLTQPDHASLLRHVRLVVVDEWHELLSTKRGTQVELALARLRAVNPLVRTWGLSATLANLAEARDALLGLDATGRAHPGRLVQGEVAKNIVIDALVPEKVERFPWSGHLNTRLLPQVVVELEQARTAILFTNTRSQAELWHQALQIARPDWEGLVAIHHGSLERAEREDAEDGLRTGRYRCVVATSSLDLGVDFAPVDLVLQVGSPKGVARLLQRAGRSGHQPGRPSRVVCVPTHALELVEIAAAREAVRLGRIEGRAPVEQPLDVLAQHLVTLGCGGGFTRDGVLAEVRTTVAYRAIADADFDWALDFAATGGPTLRAYEEYARLRQQDGRWRVASPQVARRHKLGIGTILSDPAVQVRWLTGGRIGSVEESFAARLRPGDQFLFSGKVLEFVRVRDLAVYVRKGSGKKPAIPRWAGARMPLTTELALSLREVLGAARRGATARGEMASVRPVLDTQRARSVIPDEHELLIERVRTREGHHLFIYPFEGRLVHEGLAALCAYRLSTLAPNTYTFSCNDYGFELLSPEPAPIEQALEARLFTTDFLVADIEASMNATELARRAFREIARVAGLIFTGYPGAQKALRQVQASSGLLYDVFQRHDPTHLLLAQARRDVLERQLEASRLRRCLERIAGATVRLVDVEAPTPLAFPLLVDRTREKVSSEKLADRVRRMVAQLERGLPDA
jgi:ATP-dependent Lhr-like helicase